MLDDQSYVVTYEAWRGEPRGKLAKKPDGRDPWLGRGDCVDCNACVATCPTGIDIRDGQQLECIGCGLCVDACNAVMDKVGRPRGLIRFDTLTNQQSRARGEAPTHHFVRPRTILYAVVLALVGAVMLAALLLRTTVELSVQRDRNPLYSTLVDGRIRNAFTVHVLNKMHDTRQYVLSVEGVPGALLSTIDAEAAGNSIVVSAKPDSVANARVFVTTPLSNLRGNASTKIFFRLERADGGERTGYDSVFLAPGR
jgi:cytochrome c oxidase accessory protein FixG